MLISLSIHDSVQLRAAEIRVGVNKREINGKIKNHVRNQDNKQIIQQIREDARFYVKIFSEENYKILRENLFRRKLREHTQHKFTKSKESYKYKKSSNSIALSYKFQKKKCKFLRICLDETRKNRDNSNLRIVFTKNSELLLFLLHLNIK